MFTPALTGGDSPGRADGVWLFEKGEFRFYHLATDNATWLRPGSSTDVRGKVVPPDASAIVEIRAAGRWIVNAGSVRTNDFRKNLIAGLQPFATGFPIDLTPIEARAFVDASAPAQTRWTGSASPSLADEIRLFSGTTNTLRLYLEHDGMTWRTLSDPANLAGTPVLRALGMVVIKRKNADPAYRIPAPF